MDRADSISEGRVYRFAPRRSVLSCYLLAAKEQHNDCNNAMRIESIYANIIDSQVFYAIFAVKGVSSGYTVFYTHLHCSIHQLITPAVKYQFFDRIPARTEMFPILYCRGNEQHDERGLS